MSESALRRAGRQRASVFCCPLALANLLAYRIVVSLLLSLPVALAAAGLLGSISDAELFEPGAVLLGEALRLARPYAAFGVSAWVLVFVASAWIELIPLAGVLLALRYEGPRRIGLWLPPAVRALPTLSLLWGVAALLQVAVGGGAIGAGWSIVAALPGGPTRDVGLLVLVVVALLLVVSIGVVHDASRVRAVQDQVGAWEAMTGGARLVREHRRRVSVGYAWRMAAGLAAWTAAVAWASSFGVKTSAALLAGAGLHVVALAGLVVARGSWFALLTRCKASSGAG